MEHMGTVGGLDFLERRLHFHTLALHQNVKKKKKSVVMFGLIKILPILANQWFDWFSWEWSKKRFFGNNFKMGDSIKMRFSKPLILKQHWLKQRALMWPNLYGCEAVRHKLKNSLKTQQMHFLPLFERYPLISLKLLVPTNFKIVPRGSFLVYLTPFVKKNHRKKGL